MDLKITLIVLIAGLIIYFTATMDTSTEAPTNPNKGNRDTSFSGGINTDSTPKGVFSVTPGNRVCSCENVDLECKPENRNYSTLAWEVVHPSGTRLVSETEKITLPCDNYIVQCLYTNESGTPHTSGKVNISKFCIKDPQIITCVNHGITQNFFLLIGGTNTTLYINDERANSDNEYFDGYLNLTCSSRLNNSNISLETQLPGGTGRQTVAQLIVLEASNTNDTFPPTAPNKEYHQNLEESIIVATVISIIVGIVIGIFITILAMLVFQKLRRRCSSAESSTNI